MQGMYEVGTKVDLTYLNTKRQEVPTRPKKSAGLQEREQDCGEPSRTYQAGTRVIFDRITMAIRIQIPVTFA